MFNKSASIFSKYKFQRTVPKFSAVKGEFIENSLWNELNVTTQHNPFPGCLTILPSLWFIKWWTHNPAHCKQHLVASYLGEPLWLYVVHPSKEWPGPQGQRSCSHSVGPHAWSTRVFVKRVIENKFFLSKTKDLKVQLTNFQIDHWMAHLANILKKSQCDTVTEEFLQDPNLVHAERYALVC